MYGAALPLDGRAEVGSEFQPYDGRPIVRFDRYGLRPFYERLGRLRRATPALRSGAIHLVATDHDDTVLAYLRPAPDRTPRAESGDGVLVLLNWADSDVNVRISDAATLRALGTDTAAVDLLSGAKLVSGNRQGDTGALKVSLPAHGALVLTRLSSRTP